MSRVTRSFVALTHRDQERREQAAYDRLRSELIEAFAAPDPAYGPLTATEVIARNRA